MALHYICTGTCKGISDVPGVCQDKSCVKHAQELSTCNCEDEKHFGKQGAHDISEHEEVHEKEYK